MSKLSNKIEAHDRSITEVLDDKKYTVDYFQREYKWEERHIEQPFCFFIPNLKNM